MPKVSPAHREARRQQILDAAQLCFSREGFHQTSMADIVRQSGLSHGAIYLYFQTKDDLIEALADDRHRYERMLLATAEAASDPLAGLNAIVQAFAAELAVGTHEEARRVAVQSWAEALRNPRVHATAVEGVEIAIAAIVRVLREGQAQGRFDEAIDPAAFARVLIALYQGLILQSAWQEPLEREGCTEVIARILGTLLRPGTAARPPIALAAANPTPTPTSTPTSTPALANQRS